MSTLRGMVSRLGQGAWELATIGMAKRDTVARYTMYRRIEAAMSGNVIDGPVLSVSDSQHLCHLLGARDEQIHNTRYPDADLCHLPFEDASFAALASDQVLEHIECNPQQAIDECYRVLRPGGIMAHTTCFMTPFHGDPRYGIPGSGDYWRYTHHGLMYLCRHFSRIIQADGWGHPLMPMVSALGCNWMPVPDARWHPLNWLARFDRKSYPFVVWVIAQK